MYPPFPVYRFPSLVFFYKMAIIVSSSRYKDEKEINEYHDESNSSSSSRSGSS